MALVWSILPFAAATGATAAPLNGPDDGAGAVATPGPVSSGASGHLVFEYTAAGTGTDNGEVDIAVPAPWSTPVGNSFVFACDSSTTTTLTATASDIEVGGLTLAGGDNCSVEYAYADAPSPGSYPFSTSEESTDDDDLQPLSSSPSVAVDATDASGNLTVSPGEVAPGSVGNNLTFTYTAANGGTSNGDLTMTVPGDWTAPQSGTPDSPGYVALSGCGSANIDAGSSDIYVTGLTLGAGGTCAIDYEDATAPATTETSTFATSELSSTYNLPDSTPYLASPPTVDVSTSNGGGGTTALVPPLPPPGTISSASGVSASPLGAIVVVDGGLTADASGSGALTIAQYSGDPVGPPSFTPAQLYYDVRTIALSAFSEMVLTFCNVATGAELEFWDEGTAAWLPVSDQAYTAGPPSCVTVVLSNTTAPNLSELTGTVFAVAVPAALPAPSPSPPTPVGYWMVGKDGGIFSFGPQGYYGSLPGRGVKLSDVAGIATGPSGKGYWLVGRDGGVFSFGGARYYGSLAGTTERVDDVVGIASTPDGRGYWLAAANGAVYRFGDARELPALSRLGASSGAIVGITASSGAGGYWLVSSHGSVYAFGTAHYFGSLPGLVLHPGALSTHSGDIVGMATTPDGRGYWLAAADGRVYAFGDARTYPAAPGTAITTADIVSIVATPAGAGYWLVGADGSAYRFGAATAHGSVPSTGISVRSIVGAAAF